MIGMDTPGPQGTWLTMLSGHDDNTRRQRCTYLPDITGIPKRLLAPECMYQKGTEGTDAFLLHGADISLQCPSHFQKAEQLRDT